MDSPRAGFDVVASPEWFGDGWNSYRQILVRFELAEILAAASPRDFKVNLIPEGHGCAFVLAPRAVGRSAERWGGALIGYGLVRPVQASLRADVGKSIAQGSTETSSR
jgi:hypothetical protein